MKKNILIFASSERSSLEVINVVKEIKQRGHNYFFLYINSPATQSPQETLQNFVYDTNVLDTVAYKSTSLGGITLPFIPDILLVTRENWDPEKTVFVEFKQLGTIICCIENSSWLHAEIDSKLELCSRKNFPTNLIDVFFDHSDWVFETKKLAGWVTYKSKIVGTPKYDSLVEVVTYTKHKPIILIYGSMNHFVHDKILEQAKLIAQKFHTDYEIYYKPHPVELIDFQNEFENNFGTLKNIPYIKVITQESLYQSIVKASDINIGIISSVMYYPLVLGKKTVIFNIKDIGVESGFNLESYKGKMYNFWAPIVRVKSFEEFTILVNPDFLKESIKRRDEIMQAVQENLIEYTDDFKWAEKTVTSNNEPILKYFDNYNDFQASKRIVNEIETLYV